MKKMLTTFLGATLCALPLATQAASFKVDKAKSSITVTADATGGGFTGKLKNYSASIEGNAATLKPSSAKITWKFSDLDTAEAKRDAKMLSWLETAKYPTGTFELTKTYTQNSKTYALGKLTIHGVSKTIAFPITTSKKGNTLTIKGKANINTTQFNLPIIRLLLVATVDPNLVIDFSLTGTVQ